MDAQQSPLISVVTACFNAREFIESCISSVVDQTYSCYEYIVVDGGSFDGTVDVIKRYDYGIDHWVSEPDKGISDAFNKGLDLAAGDYVLILNSDDFLAAPDILEKVAAYIESYHFPTFLYGNCDVVNRETGGLEFHANSDFSPGRLWKGEMPPHPGLFTHRSYFEKYGTFDTAFRVAMDFELLARGCQYESMVHMPLTTSFVRSGGMSTTNLDVAKNEILLALKKNGHLSSLFKTMRFKSYFASRSMIRRVLNCMGLYGIFAKLRGQSGKVPS